MELPCDPAQMNRSVCQAQLRNRLLSTYFIAVLKRRHQRPTTTYFSPMRAFMIVCGNSRVKVG